MKVILRPEKEPTKFFYQMKIRKFSMLRFTIKMCKMTIQHCQILLEFDENAPSYLTQTQIAKTFGVSKSTISNIVSA